MDDIEIVCAHDGLEKSPIVSRRVPGTLCKPTTQLTPDWSNQRRRSQQLHGALTAVAVQAALPIQPL